MDGAYKYCFSNKMSTMTPKIVMFSMEVGETHTIEDNQVAQNETSMIELIKD